MRVRQALNYAVDQDVLITDIRLGFAQKPNGQAVTPPVRGYNPNIKDYGFDPEKAGALIKEAGAEGAQLTLMCPSEYYGAVGVNTCQTLEAMYEAVGLQVELQFLPHARWIAEGLLEYPCWSRNGLRPCSIVPEQSVREHDELSHDGRNGDL